MENKYKGWSLILVSSLASVIVILSFLVFSPYMARFTINIKLRDKYISTLLSIRKVFGHNEADFCWYFNNPINPLKKNDDTYNYAIVGKLIAIDEIEKSITLECSNKKQYKLYINATATNDPNWVTIGVGVNTKADNPRDNPFLFFKSDLEASREKDPYFEEDQLYMAIWRDARELTEINKSIKNGEVFVNTTDNFILSLLRY